MAAILGVREQIVQFYYDTDFVARGVIASGDNLASSEKQLFANASPGNVLRTNMPAGGFLTGDQTFLCYAVRHEVFFHGGSVSGGDAGFDTTAAAAVWTINLTTFEFVVESKPVFRGPIAMTPAGGGPWGYVADSAQPIVTNGEPQNRGIYVLPLAIALAKRQGFQVTIKHHNLTDSTALNITTIINNYDGAKLFRSYIDGFTTRDVN